jgi:hypothetical protein
MGKGKIPAISVPVLLHVGGNSGDSVHSPLGFLGAQVLLVVGVFPSFDLLDDVVD